MCMYNNIQETQKIAVHSVNIATILHQYCNIVTTLLQCYDIDAVLQFSIFSR